MPRKPKQPKSIKFNGMKNIKNLGIDSSLIADKNFIYFLQQFIDSLPLFIIVAEPINDYKVVLVNKHLAKSLGTNVEKIIGRNFIDLFPTDEIRKRRKTYADKTFHTKKPIRFIDKRDNRYFENFSIPVFDNSGDVIYIIGVINEITEKKGLEQDMADKEQLFSAMIQNSKDMIYILTNQGKIIYRSPSAEELIGYHTDTLGESAFKNIHPEDRNTVKSRFMSLISKPGNTDFIQFQVKDVKGDYHVFDGIANNQLENPSINGVIFNCRDITENIKIQNNIKEYQRDLKKNMDYLQNVIDSATEIIFTIDRKGIIRTWNESAINHTGFKRKEIIGRDIRRINIFKQPELVLNHINNLFNRKISELKEIIIKTKYGNEKLLKVSISLIKERANIISEILFICKLIPLEEQLSYQFEIGKGYIIDDPKYNITELLETLIDASFRCLYIGRNIGKDQYRLDNVNKIHTIDFANQTGEYNRVFDLQELGSIVNDFLNKKTKSKKAIILERFDFLMIYCSFEKLIRFLYNLNDLIKRKNGLFIIKIHPDVFDQKQLKFIKMEFNQIPSEDIEDLYLDEIQFSMLQFIAKQRKMNIQVNFKIIGSKFGLSKVTVKKHIDFLLDNTLIYCEEFGRTKYIYLTPKAFQLLNPSNSKY